MVVRRMAVAVGVLLAVLAGVCRAAPPTAGKDPMIAVPTVRKAPVIDGKLSPDEWRYAAAVTMLETVGSRNVRLEQPIYYVCRDEKNFYIAMDSVESNTNTIVAACALHDHLSIIGDDCMELMLAPGTGKDVERPEFPVYYFAVNSIGTIWDCRFVPNSAESHNSWESDAEVANSVDGTHWVCEMRIPFATIVSPPPPEGTMWRFNVDRTFSGYHWAALNGRGGLNEARVGADIMLGGAVPAVRVVNPQALIDGRLELAVEVANGTDAPRTVTVAVEAAGRQDAGAAEAPVGAEKRTVTLKPGEVAELKLGKKAKILPLTTLSFRADDDSGKRLYEIERRLTIPAERFVKRVAPAVPLVNVFPRYLPSLDRLAVSVDCTAWVKKAGSTTAGVKAELAVYEKGKESGTPALSGTLTEFAQNRGVLRRDTKQLAEGEYTVKVTVTAGKETLLVHDDWFEKRVFDWMKSPRGVGAAAPDPYTPVKAAGAAVETWGRRYSFTPEGLLAGVRSQNKDLLAGPVSLEARAGGAAIPLKTDKPFSFTSSAAVAATGRSSLSGGGVKVDLESVTEYDGFVLFRMTYAPTAGPVTLDRMRLKVPMVGKYAKLYSAIGDPQGVGILGDVLPEKQGKVYDSFANTRSVCCSPSFATLFWVADYETSFCYAADNDKGWVLRDDAPAVEAWREGDQLVLWLNLVDRQFTLKEPRTLEFAFQAGPTKPLPEGWRGVQDGGNPADAPLTIIQVGGSGNTMGGGTHFLHAGYTPEQQAKSREMIERHMQGGNKVVVGYHYWGTVPKGMPETRVFRGEWGIDKRTWDSWNTPNEWEWNNKFYGPDKDRYIIAYVKPVPSYVDYTIAAYDTALAHTPIVGTYDDTGYPKPVFDEELGLGFIREDGRKVYSSGLWIYRERWKRAQYLHFLHKRPNFTRDSQHVHAHYMPAYNFIGIWAPCEHGYYNPFPDRDNLGFYRSIGRYAAFNPGRQFGQPSMVGMSSPQKDAPLFVRDTRNMMMLTMLHDQDVGCFGARDTWTVCRLRAARNIFRQWEKGTEFTGYWEVDPLVKGSSAETPVSLYRKPDGALFIVGNTATEDRTVTLTPDWKALKLDPAKLSVFDPESGGKIALSKGGFPVSVAARGLRLVLAGLPKSYAPKNAVVGAALPKPAGVIEGVSDRFDGKALDAAWVPTLHEGNAGVYMLEGRLCVQGATYGYAHVRRELPVDAASVQCMIVRAPSGGNDESGGSLFLWWANGEYVQATPGFNAGKFLAVASGAGRGAGATVNKESVFGWYPYTCNWVKIVLRPEILEFHASADGAAWTKYWEVKRGTKFAGPPQFAVLGNGHPGKNPLLANVVAAHFAPTGAMTRTFYSDFIVGRD